MAYQEIAIGTDGHMLVRGPFYLSLNWQTSINLPFYATDVISNNCILFHIVKLFKEWGPDMWVVNGLGKVIKMCEVCVKGVWRECVKGVWRVCDCMCFCPPTECKSVSMFVWLHTCICLCLCDCIHVHVYVCVTSYMYMSMCVCLYTCTCLCVCVCIHVLTMCMCAQMLAFVYLCTCSTEMAVMTLNVSHGEI